ncbi:MAG: ABC transporter ATP-binding protein [Chloroflexi bacterium]|nr:ABC transporter ATP-binding protein [Chloroflexota bacterium]
MAATRSQLSLLERLRLDHFWFWRDIGGPLPSTPPSPLRLGGLWHLLTYIRYVWWAALGLLTTIFISAYLGVQPAFIVKHIVNVDLKSHTTVPLFGDITTLSGIFLLIVLVSVVNGWFGAWATARIVWHLRKDVLDRQIAMPLAQLVGRGPGQTMVRTINEVGVAGGDSPVFTGVAGIIGTVTSSINNLVILASAIIAMLLLNARLTAWSFILLPIPIAIAVWWGRIIYGAIHRQYEKLATMTHFALSVFAPYAALRDKLLGRQQDLLAQFRRENRELTNASIYARVLFHWYDNVFQIIQGATIGILWLVGGHSIFAGTLTLGTVLAMVGLVGRLDGPIHNLAEFWFSFRSLAAVADRVSQDLEALAPHQMSAATPAPTTISAGPYRVQAALGLDTPEAPTGERLSLEVASGEVVTILDASEDEQVAWQWAALLSGWRPPLDGTVELAGIDLPTAAPETRRAAVSLISATLPLPGATVRMLWQAAAPHSLEAEWRMEWDKVAAACAVTEPYPVLDAPLDDGAADRQLRFLVSLVAARLHTAPLWISVAEPAGLRIPWEHWQQSVLRVQPEEPRAASGTFVVRQADGHLEMQRGALQEGSVLERPVRVVPRQRSWSRTILEDDGRGWWASLGLRRHRTQHTSRFWAPFKQLMQYMARYWVYWLVILVLGEIIASFNNTFAPLITREIIDVGVGKHQVSTLNTYAVFLILLSVVWGLANICFVTTWVQTGGKRMSGEVREVFFSRLVRATFSFFRTHESSEVASRIINDVNAIFAGTDAIIKVVTWMVIPNIPGMVLLWFLGPRFGVLTLVVVIPFAAATMWVGRLNSRLQERTFGVVGAMASELRELASPARAFLLRAQGFEREERRLTGALNDLLYRLGLAQMLRGNWFGSVQALEGNVVTVLFWLVGGLAIIHGQLLLGTLTAVMAYGQRYVGLGGAVNSYVAIHGILANFDRLEEYARQGSERVGQPEWRPAAQSTLTLVLGDGAAQQTLSLQPGVVMTLAGAPERLAEIRDAVLALRPVETVEIRDGFSSLAAVPLDGWRRAVAWLHPAYPFAGATLAELLRWAAGPDGAVDAGSAMLGLRPDDPAMQTTAESWVQGDPQRALQLTAVLAVAARPRLVLVDHEASGVPGVDAVVAQLCRQLTGSTMLVLVPSAEKEVRPLATAQSNGDAPLPS